MRHASPEDLEQIADLVSALRATDTLTERTPGVFYRRSKAFLHFHADPHGFYADVRIDHDAGFERVRVTTKAEQRRLLSSIRKVRK